MIPAALQVDLRRVIALGKSRSLVLNSTGGLVDTRAQINAEIVGLFALPSIRLWWVALSETTISIDMLQSSSDQSIKGIHHLCLHKVR